MNVDESIHLLLLSPQVIPRSLFYRSVRMPRPILYTAEMSPPCRAVLLAAEAIGVQLEKREISIFNRDQLQESFQKINPQHTIPTLDDNGHIIWDSHAIICYLCDKYGRDDSLYPKDLERRAIIDQRLYFDCGILFALLRGIAAFVPVAPYPNVARWLKICEEELPGYARANGPGVKMFHEYFRAKLQP
ncbi:glutathione S-transferase D7 isoform X2 [Fopius arisanus]|uniref:Glutathione S-transferase D7 isoform X2 n=1 Tax=Fopius arisanus TaxID=64838 RepID=A0A9R1T849_9HYME|nr:PREDICTED: glutathione S-transferase D7-like isoform X2 [Fopius arisanus]